MSILLEDFRSITDRHLETLEGQTKDTYGYGLAKFFSFLEERGINELPVKPQTVAVFMESLLNDGYKSGTIENYTSAVSWAHQKQGYDSPCHDSCVDVQMQTVYRTLGDDTITKRPIFPNRIAQMSFDDTIHGVRNQSMVTLAWFAGMRPLEVVSLTRDQLTVLREHAIIETGELINKPVHDLSDLGIYPLNDLKRWLSVSDGDNRSVVYPSIDRWNNMGGQMTPRSFRDIVEVYLEQIGINYEYYTADSLRYGYYGLTKQAA